MASVASRAEAATVFWNPGGSGGDGIWGTTPGEKNWNSAAGAPAAGNVSWQDGIDDVAVFTDANGGTVTIFDMVRTAGIRQQGADYRIDAGTITLAADSAANRPFIGVTTGTLTILSDLDGSGGFDKTGSGALVLSGSNPIAGILRVEDGELRLAGTLASDELMIAGGASMVNENGGLSATAALTNAGSLTLAVDDTITSYVSNGGTLANGTGTLFTTIAALDDGSTVAGTLSTGSLSSNGAVSIGGNTTVTDTASVQSGTLNLTGTLATPDLNISSGATMIQNGTMGPGGTTVVTNEGSLIIQNTAVLDSYTSNGGLLDIRDQRMITRNVFLNDGSMTTGGPFSADVLVTNGNVTIAGSALGDVARIASGSLQLQGNLSSRNVEILAGATLLNQNGGLSNSALLTNAGSLTFAADDTIGSYISNGGTLAAGAGTMFATTAELNDGSVIAGLANTNSLTSADSVRITGTVAAENIDITSGTLTNTGNLGSPTSMLNLNQGAALAAGGLQQFALLTTTGAGPGTWRGDLFNTDTVAPGGVGGTGILAVDGDFTQSPSGILKLDLSRTASDLLGVSGNAVFGGSLELNQAGDAIRPFVPVMVVSAAAYGGNITSLSENLDGAVWFNPGNGSVTRLELPTGGGNLSGATRSQTSTWISLYDDVIDPGFTNITGGDASGYAISSGIANASNPDMLWALAASFTPDGLNAPLLNRLSPEVYSSLGGYAMQATRHHQRTAMSAPSLAATATPEPAGPKSGTAGAKNPVAAAGLPSRWEAFAAVDHFRAETSRSPNESDLDFHGTGVMAGARGHLGDYGVLAAYLAGNDGAIRGDLIQGDASGFSLGLAADWLLHAPSATRLTTAVSYGRYEFDGRRASVAADSSGWRPAPTGFSTTASSFEWFTGVGSSFELDPTLRVLPSSGLRFATGSMRGFSESGAGGIPLNVAGDNYEVLLLESAVRMEADLSERIMLTSDIGFSAMLHDSGHGMSATFAGGGRPMRAESGGLSDDMLFLGIGAVFRIRDDLSVGAGYRSEWRGGDDRLNSGSISATFRF